MLSMNRFCQRNFTAIASRTAAVARPLPHSTWTMRVFSTTNLRSSRNRLRSPSVSHSIPAARKASPASSIGRKGASDDLLDESEATASEAEQSEDFDEVHEIAGAQLEKAADAETVHQLQRGNNPRPTFEELRLPSWLHTKLPRVRNSADDLQLTSICRPFLAQRLCKLQQSSSSFAK